MPQYNFVNVPQVALQAQAYKANAFNQGRREIAAQREDADYDLEQEYRKAAGLYGIARAMSEIEDDNEFIIAGQELLPYAIERGWIDDSKIDITQAPTREGIGNLLQQSQAMVDALKPQLGMKAQRSTNGKSDALGAPAEQRLFEYFRDVAQLSDDDARRAARIELGLDPRSGTQSSDERITDAGKGRAEEVGDTRAIIREREKFGEMSGSKRAQIIDSAFESIGKITKNISNIDRAIEAIDEGADTGFIESRFFPSVREATLKLEQVQKELGLDVIGSVTFGALSEGELRLALDTALPTNLQEKELRAFLVSKKEAQDKLRSYLYEQIDFLDQGGSVAGFLRMKQRGDQTESGVVEDGQPITAINPDTNERMIFRDGRWEPYQ